MIESISAGGAKNATLGRKITLDNARALFAAFRQIQALDHGSMTAGECNPQNQGKERSTAYENRAYGAGPYGRRHRAAAHQQARRRRLGAARRRRRRRRRDAAWRIATATQAGVLPEDRDRDLGNHRGQWRAENVHWPKRAAGSRRQGQAAVNERAATDDRPRACPENRGEGRAAHRSRRCSAPSRAYANGELFWLTSGGPRISERARVVLDKLTRRIAHMGPNGSGLCHEARGQSGALRCSGPALWESLALGMKQGLTLEPR